VVLFQYTLKNFSEGANNINAFCNFVIVPTELSVVKYTSAGYFFFTVQQNQTF
jgi:hypothetical protein